MLIGNVALQGNCIIKMAIGLTETGSLKGLLQKQIQSSKNSKEPTWCDDLASEVLVKEGDFMLLQMQKAFLPATNDSAMP